MTFQDFFSILNAYKIVVLIILLVAPWLALGLCMVIPSNRIETLVLNFNLGMAFLSLLLAMGYILYATNQGGWEKIIKETDMLLLLSPFYYGGVSLWITRQRVSLSALPIVRVVQGIALITASFLGISWLLRKARIIVLAYISTPLLLLIGLGFIGIAYLGYSLLTDFSDHEAAPKHPKRSSKTNPAAPSAAHQDTAHQDTHRHSSIDDELEELRRNLGK